MNHLFHFANPQHVKNPEQCNGSDDNFLKIYEDFIMNLNPAQNLQLLECLFKYRSYIDKLDKDLFKKLKDILMKEIQIKLEPVKNHKLGEEYKFTGKWHFFSIVTGIGFTTPEKRQAAELLSTTIQGLCDDEAKSRDLAVTTYFSKGNKTLRKALEKDRLGEKAAEFVKFLNERRRECNLAASDTKELSSAPKIDSMI